MWKIFHIGGAIPLLEGSQFSPYRQFAFNLLPGISFPDFLLNRFLPRIIRPLAKVVAGVLWGLKNAIASRQL